MSYDLYFYQPTKSELSREVIADFLSANLTPKDEEFDEWLLENERTGVHFQFVFDNLTPNSDGADDGGIPTFDTHVFTGLVLYLNYGRPDFFGLEAFQFVEKLMNQLDLSVYDPQATGEVDRLTRPKCEELFATWSPTNNSATDLFRQQSPDDFAYLHAEKSSGLWRYNYQVAQIQTQLGDDIFVPTAFFLKRKSDELVFTAATWVEGIGQLIPPADLFAVVRKRKRLLRPAVEEKGLIARETMMAAFGKYLREYHVAGCAILYPKQAEALAQEFTALKFEYSLDEFVRLASAGVTNVKLSARDS